MKKIKRREKYPVFEKQSKEQRAAGIQKVWINKDDYVVISFGPKAIGIAIVSNKVSRELAIHPVSYNTAHITFHDRYSAYWEFDEEHGRDEKNKKCTRQIKRRKK